LRYTNIPKDKRDDVITIHTVETTEKVTNYYQVIGLNKKQAREAVENDGYYDADDRWVHIEPEEHRDYGSMSKPKISNTQHYIPCFNHGCLLEKEQENPSGRNWMSHHTCYQIMQIPKHTLNAETCQYEKTQITTWIRQNPVCHSCRRKIKQGYALKEVTE